MNQGIYGFPNTLATSSIISITDFDASGTYTIPTDASEIEILLVGGGGGGGSGARASGTATTNRGGGGGGSGGGIVYQKIQTKDLAGRNNLIITIGAGGLGGVSRSTNLAANAAEAGAGGFPGANSVVSISNYPGFVLQAGAGGGGGAGGTPLAAGSGAAPGRSFLISSAPAAMEGGANGNSTVNNVNGLTYSSFRSTGGAGGGSATSTTVALPGGDIKISRVNTNTDPLFLNLLFAGITLSGFTALYGGQINGGTLGGKGDNGFSMHRNSAGSYLFGGFGGAGGGGANTVGGGNGGDGYRGGGGGGGGGVHNSGTLGTGQVPSGAGGNGGNGFCRIIARR